MLESAIETSGDTNVEIWAERMLLKIDKVSSQHWNNLILGKIPVIIIEGSKQ